MYKQKPSSMPQFGVCVCVFVTQSCPILCDPIDCSPPGSSVHGILQARTVEWASFPTPGDLSKPGIEPRSPALKADSSQYEPQGLTYTQFNTMQYAFFYWRPCFEDSQWSVHSTWFWAVTIKSSFGCYYMEVTDIFFQEESLAPGALQTANSVTLTLIPEDKGLLVIWSLSGRGPRRGQ